MKYGILLLAMFLCIGVVSAEDRGYISSQGSAETEVSPDIVMIRLSVVTENSDVKLAQSSNSYTMNNVINSLIEFGIKEEDIQTVGYNIYPVYDDSVFTKKVKYYRVQNSIVVKTKYFDNVGNLIDRAVASGVNEVSSIQFTLSNEKERAVYLSLIESAARSCKTDAEILASSFGSRIVGVRDANVYHSGVPVFYGKYDAMSYAPTPDVAYDTRVEPRMITMSVSVSASFFIE
jgi:hypothetical protein